MLSLSRTNVTQIMIPVDRQNIRTLAIHHNMQAIKLLKSRALITKAFKLLLPNDVIPGTAGMRFTSRLQNQINVFRVRVIRKRAYRLIYPYI